MGKVLTSKALWQDFDPQIEPLETNVLKMEEQDGIITKTVYFTGRSVEDGKTRVLAKVCYKASKKPKNAVLLIDNYKKSINEEELRYWANHGFVSVAIDFAGRRTKGACTLYPPSLDYCNSDVAEGYFYVGTGAKQTKIYEYALNCMRAVTYLLQEEKTEKVSVITVKKGTAVGIIVLCIDKRVVNGTVMFGSLYREYGISEQVTTLNQLNDEELAQHVAFEEKRQIWEAGIAPQAYASQTKVPVYLIVATNSPHVSSLNSNKMYYRLNDESRMLMLPLSIDYMSEEYVKSIVNFCKEDYPPENTSLEQITTEKGDNFLKVTSPLPVSKLEVWYSRSPDRRCRNWVKANLKSTDDGYIAELDAYSQNCKMIAFAVAKGSVCISTALCDVEINKPSSVKIPNRNLFSGENGGSMIPYVLGGGFHGLENQVEYCKGYLGIRGAKGKVMATFALNDPSTRRREIFTVSFDVCCETAQQLHVYVVSDFGSENEIFHQTVQLSGDGKWQRITLDGNGFQKADGKPMSDDENVEMLYFKADSEYIINNVFIV